jgi:predicted GNAT family N-acyltransferase
MTSIEIIDGSWKAMQTRAMPIRMQVFVREQQVPIDLEQDDQDATAHHWVAQVGAECVGTVRLTMDGHLGRLAVLAQWRQQGIGAQLTECVVRHALAHGQHDLDLNAQTHAIPFYEALGFVVDGPEFMEAGMPHRHMRLRRASDVG